MNPKYKEFMEKHPDKTMIGMAWAYYWRLMILVFILEALVLLLFLLVGAFAHVLL